MKKLIIFDLDGTLIDSIKSIGNTCNKALKINGLEERTLEEYKYFAGDGALELVKRAIFASGDNSYEKLECVYKKYREYFDMDCTREVQVFEHIESLLKQIIEKGIKIAVLSNKPHNQTVEVVNKVFGENTFDIVLGYEKEENKKPEPYGALYIAEKLKINTEDCLYIGDTDTDMQTGKNAKMYTIGVTWGFRKEEELLKNGADAIVKTPLEILQYI